MSIGSRATLVFFFGILCLFACVPQMQVQPFSFSNHSIKLHYDPISQELTAVDTLSVHYEKNVDRLYFFLQKSLSVERVSVGHQEFRIGEMDEAEIDDLCEELDKDWQQLVEQAQIVVVFIPKSLYPERIEIRYRGQIDLSTDTPKVWHPILPGNDSTFFVTSIIPREYEIQIDGQVLQEEDDDVWRLDRVRIAEPQACCAIQIIAAST